MKRISAFLACDDARATIRRAAADDGDGAAIVVDDASTFVYAAVSVDDSAATVVAATAMAAKTASAKAAEADATKGSGSGDGGAAANGGVAADDVVIVVSGDADVGNVGDDALVEEQALLGAKDVNGAGTNDADDTNAAADDDGKTPAFSLTDVSLRLQRGSFTAVVGPVGAGKSSLLAALLGDMQCTRGGAAVYGRVAYVPQKPWIQNMTVRDNILFGRAFDEKRYATVLRVCALGEDMSSLPAGDLTHIGDKGINLSGGQKARVSLCRAVYSDADVYIMDSPVRVFCICLCCFCVAESCTRFVYFVCFSVVNSRTYIHRLQRAHTYIRTAACCRRCARRTNHLSRLHAAALARKDARPGHARAARFA
jgi:ABC-type lipoprotein export system ATPase subunit